MPLYRVKYLYQKIKEGYKQKENKMFSLHSCYLICIFFIFSGLWCLSLVNASLIPFFLLFSSLALLLTSYFRSYGYYVISSLFLIAYGYRYVSTSSSLIWSCGIAISFLISWGLLSLILSYIDQHSLDQEVMYNQLRQEHESVQNSYNVFLKEREDQIQAFENEKIKLQKELDKVQLMFQDSQKKQAHLIEDLQILSDQKTSWASDYARLHNEYVKLIMGDESMNAFSWASRQEKQDGSVDSPEFSCLNNNTKS